MRRSDRILQIGVVGLLALCTYLLLPPLRSIENTLPPPSRNSIGSVVGASSFAELVKATGMVVIGQITPTSDTINMARDLNNINEPDTRIYIAGKVYRVDVERYLRGQGGNVLYIVQPESWLDLETTMTPNAYEIGKGSYKAIIPRANTRYLLFLGRLEGFPNQQYYTGGIHPWRFDASDLNRVVPEDPWPGAEQDFPPQPLSSIIQQVQGSPVRAPTPALTPTSTTEPATFKRQYDPGSLETKPGGVD